MLLLIFQPALNESRQSTMSTTGSFSSGSGTSHLGGHSSNTIITDTGSDVIVDENQVSIYNGESMVLSLPPLQVRPVGNTRKLQGRHLETSFMRDSFEGVMSRTSSTDSSRGSFRAPAAADNFVIQHKVNKAKEKS